MHPTPDPWPCSPVRVRPDPAEPRAHALHPLAGRDPNMDRLIEWLPATIPADDDASVTHGIKGRVIRGTTSSEQEKSGQSVARTRGTRMEAGRKRRQADIKVSPRPGTTG
jgi:hypothetical protein